MPKSHQKGLHFEIKNLGVIARGEFTQKPLTVFCGPSNSGKTLAMYSLYNAHKKKMLLPDELRGKKGASRQAALTKFNGVLNRSLNDVFNADEALFRSSKFNLGVDSIDEFVGGVDSDVFLIPAERNALHLIFRELRTRRTALLHHASKRGVDLNDLLKDVISSRYARPIADYIDWLNIISEGKKPKSSAFHAHALHLQKKLVGGKYSVDSRTNDIHFTAYQNGNGTNGTNGTNGKKAAGPLGLHQASGAAKSLFGLWAYLEYQAKPGDTLMIDEPELNLHPKNQVILARLLVRLVNAGLNIVVSTHSDFMTQEFNTMILLSYTKRKTLGKTYGFHASEALRLEQISAYLFDNHKVEPLKYIKKDGFRVRTFDLVIKDQEWNNNELYDEIRSE